MQQIRIVDDEERALAGVKVALGVAGRPESVTFASTDPDGTCSFGGLSAGEYLAQLSHAVHGVQTASVRFAAVSREPIVVVMAPTSFVEVLLQDGAEPVSGATAAISDPHLEKRFDLPLRTSGADGVARWANAANGTYVVGVLCAGYFPVRSTVSAGEPAQVQVRRTGDLMLRLTGPEGAPVVGRTVDLVDVQTGASLPEWQALRWLDLPNGEARTDEQGRLHIRGLPHGEYEWSVGDDSGLLRVAPRVETTVSAVVSDGS
jgi:hypothetical protein